MPTIFSLVWYGDQTLQSNHYEKVVCGPPVYGLVIICLFSEIYFYIGYIMPTIFDLVWYGDTTLQLKYYEEVVCAPFGRWVGEYKFYGAKLSVFHCGAKLSVFTWRCQIVRFYMTVPNCPRCQIVRFTWRCQIVRVPNCPFLHCGAKLSVFHCGAKLSAVPNCPFLPHGAKLSGCQIVRGAKLSAVPNCPGAKLS